ncbi:MAG: hypothetical protein HN368_24110 [Spirochaetales bacterium]|jgi:hypothetical protein|nr:hypothetical protein [Spirochaetales bacterium]
MSQFGLKAKYYQQFDADYNLDVPAEGYGGWQEAEIPLDTTHTALVIMHAYHGGENNDFPGWYRAVEYLPRANKIAADILPGLLSSARIAGIKVYHVVGNGAYYRGLKGYKQLAALSPPPSTYDTITENPNLEALKAFRDAHVFLGNHNKADVTSGFEKTDFYPAARPAPGEAIAADSSQLFTACSNDKIGHLLYAGFAINWCLLHSPGGMLDMRRHGLMCSAFEQTVTAVENKESARDELHKEEALWRVALEFGFVLDVDNFITACLRLQKASS